VVNRGSDNNNKKNTLCLIFDRIPWLYLIQIAEFIFALLDVSLPRWNVRNYPRIIGKTSDKHYFSVDLNFLQYSPERQGQILIHLKNSRTRKFLFFPAGHPFPTKIDRYFSSKIAFAKRFFRRQPRSVWQTFFNDLGHDDAVFVILIIRFQINHKLRFYGGIFHFELAAFYCFLKCTKNNDISFSLCPKLFV